MKETEIKAVLRCIPKVIDKFIDYEQGIISREANKGIATIKRYWNIKKKVSRNALYKYVVCFLMKGEYFLIAYL